MANWVRDFLQKNPDFTTRIVKRGRYSITIKDPKNSKKKITYITGAPIHYQDNNSIWHELDTAIKKLNDIEYGAYGIPIRLLKNGLVKILNEKGKEFYSQITGQIGILNINTMKIVEYISLPIGEIDDDKIIRETDIYRHELILKEMGLREELILLKKPNFIKDTDDFWLVLDTVVTGLTFDDGWLDKYKVGQFNFSQPRGKDTDSNESPIRRYAKIIDGEQHIFTGIPFSWLYYAVYPVLIDPDYSVDSDIYFIGQSGTYSTARSTMTSYNDTSTNMYVGQDTTILRTGRTYKIYRPRIGFDTSAIGSDTITQVNLKLVPASNPTDLNDDFDVQISQVTDTSFSDSAYDDILSADADNSIFKNTQDLSMGTQTTSGDLDTSWIDTDGTTYYGLRSSKDYDNISPSGFEYIAIYSQESSDSSHRPVLVVAHVSVGNNYTLTCAADSYSLTGTACTLVAQFNYALSCSPATYTLTGTDTGFEIHYTLAIGDGVYVLAGVDVALTKGLIVSADAGLYNLSGTDATLEVKRNYELSADSGTYELTGTGATFVLLRNYTLSLGAGSYNLIGTDAVFVLQRNYTLLLESGLYSLTGADAAFELKGNYVLSLDAGNYALTGADVILTANYNLSVAIDAGDYALAGIDINFVLQRNYVLSLGAGAYALTGENIAFELLRNYSLGLDAGEYVLAGTGAILTLQRNYILSIEAGLYEITGIDITLLAGYKLTMGAGSYALTGADIAFALQHSYTLTAEADLYTLTGTNLEIIVDRILSLDAGEYILTGTDANLWIIGLTPESRIYTIPAEDRTYTISAESRTYTISAEDRTYTIPKD